MGLAFRVPQTDHQCNKFSYPGFEVEKVAIQGWRAHMEDAFVCQSIPSKPDHILLGVFDGHNGFAAADFASKQIIHYVENNNDAWRNYVKSDYQAINMIGNALDTAFKEIDKLLLHQSKQFSSRGHFSGSTAVVVLITPTHMVCANAGDSRCVLGSGNRLVTMSRDHKPYNLEERRRIERAGGTVRFNRIQGTLAVSRGLGDFQFKSTLGLKLEDQMVICTPEIIVHKRKADDEVLILASDGVWDVMSSDDVLKLARPILYSPEISVANQIVNTAFKRGSKDNITAVVAKFQGSLVDPGAVPPSVTSSGFPFAGGGSYCVLDNMC